MITLIDSIIQLILKIWEWANNHPKKKLEKNRLELIEQSKKAQLNGDLDELRKIRAQIEEINRRLEFRDY